VEVALIDAAVDSYVDWREESAAVRRAYRRWAGADRGERPGAFPAYVAALDQEERAGRRYAQVIAYFHSVRLKRARVRRRRAWRLRLPRAGRGARP
jgi:type II secretory pathway component PulK